MKRFAVVLIIGELLVYPGGIGVCFPEEDLVIASPGAVPADQSEGGVQTFSGTESSEIERAPFVANQEDILLSTANDLEDPQPESDAGSVTVESDTLTSTANGAFEVETGASTILEEEGNLTYEGGA